MPDTECELQSCLVAVVSGEVTEQSSIVIFKCFQTIIIITTVREI